MNYKYSVYVTMILYCMLSSVIVGGEKVFRKNDQLLSCGVWLSNIIYNFCNNAYKIVKRDTTSVMMEKLTAKSLQRNTNIQRLVDKGQWLRVRRQVASECCLQPCAVADLISYCPEDARLVKENPEIFDD